jgi:hypothetical protein
MKSVNFNMNIVTFVLLVVVLVLVIVYCMKKNTENFQQTPQEQWSPIWSSYCAPTGAPLRDWTNWPQGGTNEVKNICEANPECVGFTSRKAGIDGNTGDMTQYMLQNEITGVVRKTGYGCYKKGSPLPLEQWSPIWSSYCAPTGTAHNQGGWTNWPQGGTNEVKNICEANPECVGFTSRKAGIDRNKSGVTQYMLKNEITGVVGKTGYGCYKKGLPLPLEEWSPIWDSYCAPTGKKSRAWANDKNWTNWPQGGANEVKNICEANAECAGFTSRNAGIGGNTGKNIQYMLKNEITDVVRKEGYDCYKKGSPLWDAQEGMKTKSMATKSMATKSMPKPAKKVGFTSTGRG